MRKLSMLALVFTVAACDRSKPELERKVAQLEQLSAEKDSLLNDASTTAQFITEVNEEMAKVRNLNSGKLVQAGNGEKFLSPAEQRAVVLTRVKAITLRLKESEARLDASRKRVAALDGTTTEMKRELAAYDSSVTSFKAIIESQRAQMESLNGQLAALRAENAGLTRSNMVLAADKKQVIDERDNLTVERNTVYYIVGTRKELLAKHVIEQTGGALGFGKTIVPARNLNPADFTAIDRSVVAEIGLPKSDKNYRIVTRQNVGALETVPDKNGHVSVALKIKDGAEFWATSKYLIIVES